MTYFVGAAGGRRTSGRSIVLAGVAVAALLTAFQTYIQQQHSQQIQQIYNWILGSLSVASWSDVALILPYVDHQRGAAARPPPHPRRASGSARRRPAHSGIHPERARLIIVAAATLGTAAAVSVSGLIGFVGIIVPHAVRLTTNASYRVVLPVSMIGGAAFLVLADLVARTVEAPAELPIGVVTACIGAPFFLFVLVSRGPAGGL